MKVLFLGAVQKLSWPGGEPKVARMLRSVLSAQGLNITVAFSPRQKLSWKLSRPWPVPSVVVLDPEIVNLYRHYVAKVRPDVIITWSDFDLSAFWSGVLSGTPTIVEAMNLWPVCPKSDLFNMMTQSPCDGPNRSCGPCVVRHARAQRTMSSTASAVAPPLSLLFSVMEMNKIKRFRSKLSHASAIVSDNLFLKNTMAKLDYDTRKVHVIYNGVDLNIAKPSTTDNREKIVLFLSHQISAQMGCHHFVQLSRNLKPEFPKVRFLWVGQQRLRGDTFETQKYIWNDQELQEIYRSSYLLVLPSLWPETLSYASQQAMAHGKPVVAYDTGANREAIIHNETGLLAEWGNIDQLTSHVRSLLLDEKTAKRMGCNARKRVQEKFSLEQMTSSYVKLIEETKQTRA